MIHHEKIYQTPDVSFNASRSFGLWPICGLAGANPGHGILEDRGLCRNGKTGGGTGSLGRTIPALSFGLRCMWGFDFYLFNQNGEMIPEYESTAEQSMPEILRTSEGELILPIYDEGKNVMNICGWIPQSGNCGHWQG